MSFTCRQRLTAFVVLISAFLCWPASIAGD